MNKGVLTISNQFITHSIELIDENHPTIAQFQLSLMLLVPSSHIATDIRTGFPSLVRNKRLTIDELVLREFVSYTEKNDCESMRPLIYADNILQSIEAVLANFFSHYSEMEVVSCNISLFAESDELSTVEALTTTYNG